MECANPLGLADGCDQELDCTGVLRLDAEARRLGDDTAVADEPALDEIDRAYAALELTDDCRHEKITAQPDAGAVEGDGGSGDGCDA